LGLLATTSNARLATAWQRFRRLVGPKLDGTWRWRLMKRCAATGEMVPAKADFALLSNLQRYTGMSQSRI
jgi:hypothetical protein